MRNPLVCCAALASRRHRKILLAGMSIGLSVITLHSTAAIYFLPGDYDNTANTVGPGPTPTNNQTAGAFRDVFWWSINNGQPRVGSPDFINAGNSLVLSNNHAVPGPGPYTSLNFTGPSISGGQTYMSIYDTTVGDGIATRSLFDATIPGGIVISADVLFVKHNASGGVVALYNEGTNGLALLANNADGNNPDHTRLDLVWRSQDDGTVLSSVTLPATNFVVANWYRITMGLTVTGDTWTMNGTFQRHLNGLDPTSGLDGVITNMTYSGSVLGSGLTNPGEVGILAMGNESISLPDNVGVSVTGFNVVPEPSAACLLGLGALALVLRKRR